MKLTDLVVLTKAQYSCYASVLSVNQAKKDFPESQLEIDVKKGTFSTVKWNHKEERPLGSSTYAEQIISVYDRTNLAHLKLMVGAATEATREHHWDVD